MELTLVADTFLGLDLSSPWVYWPLVVVGLGLVIFIHELGHFAVAKLCGVKVEKFFVGFDIGGIKLSRRWGETEYGIGILPLGGYVKMLGQDDNPYKVAEEMERARIAGNGSSGDSGDSATPQLDPRSYLAKSVPQRMAIISAGVIMNVVLAFVLAAIAYSMGVDYEPAVVGSVSPGSAAWQVGLRPGDRILQVGDYPTPKMRSVVKVINFSFRDSDTHLDLLIQRPGVPEPFTVTVAPRVRPGSDVPIRTIGVASTLVPVLSRQRPTAEGSPADLATPKFQPGDRIVEVDGVPISTFADLARELARRMDRTVDFAVRRTPPENGSESTQPPAPGETVRIRVSPNRMRRLGLIMAMGEITAVRDDSPAQRVGIRPGDQITRIETLDPVADVPLDPMVLPERLLRLTGQRIAITLDRKGAAMQRVELNVPPPDWYEVPSEGDPLSIPALGIAYRVLNQVEAVEPGSPAARSGRLQRGHEITRIQFLQPDDRQARARPTLTGELDYALGVNNPHWPFAEAFLLQHVLPGTKVLLTIKGQEDNPVELQPEESLEWHTPQRGLRLQPLTETEIAASFGDALRLGLRETGESLTLVVEFLRRITYLWRGMGGPISIVKLAGESASSGLAQLLIFLAMLSANLAVINALPIPVLDGGHFLFLALEGIRGKPVSERLFVLFTYLGFAFILGLMILAITLDIIRL